MPTRTLFVRITECVGDIMDGSDRKVEGKKCGQIIEVQMRTADCGICWRGRRCQMPNGDEVSG
jgi:hypothetical protein